MIESNVKNFITKLRGIVMREWRKIN